MKPTPKAPAIENLLTKLNGISRQDAARQRICTNCRMPAVEFDNHLSETEYAISGLCQTCQDEIFGKDE